MEELAKNDPAAVARITAIRQANLQAEKRDEPEAFTQRRINTAAQLAAIALAKTLAPLGGLLVVMANQVRHLSVRQRAEKVFVYDLSRSMPATEPLTSESVVFFTVTGSITNNEIQLLYQSSAGPVFTMSDLGRSEALHHALDLIEKVAYR